MNVQSLLAELRIPYRTAGQHEHARPGWIQIDCPYCSPSSNRFRLGINLAKGYASCWCCGGKRLVDVMSAVTRQPIRVCYEWLHQLKWDTVAHIQPRRSGKLQVPKTVGRLLPPHRQYLHRRGFDPDEIAGIWGVQGIGIDSRLGWSLFIPIHHKGEIVSWTTRSIGDGPRRYISAGANEEAIPAKHLLYGADLAQHAIIVCEGPIDAWAIGPGAVATMGLNYSKEQFIAMTKYPVRVVCFDNEPKAQYQAERLASELSQYPGDTYCITLETGKDAAESDKQEIQELRARYLGLKT